MPFSNFFVVASRPFGRLAKDNTTSLNVLHLIDSGGLYGAENVLLELVREQQTLGGTPVIASMGDTGVEEKPLEKEARRQNLAVVPFRFKPGPNLLGALRIRQYAIELHFDILHSHGYKGNILFGFLPKTFLRIPIITTLHGWTSTRRGNRMWAYEQLDRISLRRLNAVVLVSAAMKQHPYLKNHRLPRLHVVSNGIPEAIPCSRENELDSNLIDFCRGGRTIGAIGRLSKEKGFDRLIDAFSKLTNRFPDVRLMILGEGRMRNDLETLICRFGLRNSVALPGYRPNAHRYLPFWEVFTLSSETEGLPITVLEAMRAGVPVAATPVGGIPDALDQGRSGWLFKDSTAESIYRGLDAALSDNRTTRIKAESGRKRFGENYTSRRMAENYLAIYRHILYGGNSRP